MSNNSILKRLGWNTLSYGYSQFITLAVQFIQVPLYLKFWGAPRYGEWLVLTGLPMTLSLLDLGVGQASSAKATIEASAGRVENVKKCFHTLLAFSNIIGIAIIIFSFIAAFSFPWHQILNLKTISQFDTIVIFTVMAGYIAIQLQGGVIDTSFRIADKFPIGAFLLANRRLLDVIGSFVFLICGASPVKLAIYLTISQLIYLIVSLIIAKKISPYPLFSYSCASKEECKSIIKPALSYLGFPLAQAVTLQGGIQILNQISSPSTVVAFSMCRTLVRIVIQLAVISNNALRPELSRLAGRGEIKRLETLTKRISIITSIIATISFAGIIWTGPYILKIWSKNSVTEPRITIFLIGIHALLNVYWFVEAAAKISQNLHNRLAFSYFMSSVLALGAWWISKDWMPPFLGAAILLSFPEVTMIINNKIGKNNKKIIYASDA